MGRQHGSSLSSKPRPWSAHSTVQVLRCESTLVSLTPFGVFRGSPYQDRNPVSRYVHEGSTKGNVRETAKAPDGLVVKSMELTSILVQLYIHLFIYEEIRYDGMREITQKMSREVLPNR